MVASSRSDGTPGGQTVAERFHMDWATALVSSFGAIVVRCDGRGSGFQGTNLLHWIQKRLGVFEEQDQKDALRYVSILSPLETEQTSERTCSKYLHGWQNALLGPIELF